MISILTLRMGLLQRLCPGARLCFFCDHTESYTFLALDDFGHL